MGLRAVPLWTLGVGRRTLGMDRRTSDGARGLCAGAGGIYWRRPGGWGGNVGWFPLGPREVYVPPYQVSRGYMNQVNVSNTTVNITIVTNVYNTTIINKTHDHHQRDLCEPKRAGSGDGGSADVPSRARSRWPALRLR